MDRRDAQGVGVGGDGDGNFVLGGLPVVQKIGQVVALPGAKFQNSIQEAEKVRPLAESVEKPEGVDELFAQLIDAQLPQPEGAELHAEGFEVSQESRRAAPGAHFPNGGVLGGVGNFF